MAYKDFYRMQAEAFGSLPVLNLFYSSRTHQDGWRCLIGGISSREPFLLVTGGYGMGKTMLSMMLARLLEKKRLATLVHITDPHCGFAGILRQTAARLAIDVHPRDEETLLDAIYAHLHEQNSQQPIAIIIDDAQELGIAALARLRAFANFNRNGVFPVQLIFFAHPLFSELLKDSQLTALNQRIKRRHQLTPLALQETREYIYFRLFKSGAPGAPAFTDEALREICSATGGIPRLINNLCDASLERGACKMELCISQETVREARAASSERFPLLAGPSAQPAGAFLRGDGRHTQCGAPIVHIATGKQPDQTPALPRAQAATASRRPRKLALAGIAAALAAACLIVFFLERLDAPGITHPQDSLPDASAPLPIALAPAAPADTIPGEDRRQAAESISVGAGAFYAPPPLAAAAHAPLAGEPLHSVDNQTGISGAPGLPVPSASDTLIAFAAASTEILSELPEADSTDSAAQDLPRPYTLRLACFNTPETALNASSIYARRELSPFVVKAKVKQGGWWWIFYMGVFASREEALRARDIIDQPDAHVIHMPYACRIGVFDSADVADDMAAGIVQLGCAPYVLNNSDETVSLFAGVFKQRVDAEALRKALSDRNIQSTVVLLRSHGSPLREFSPRDILWGSAP